jgi:hypothetical protein
LKISSPKVGALISFEAKESMIGLLAFDVGKGS